MRSSVLRPGVLAAVKQYAWQDKLVTLVVLIGISTPSFFLGIMMILWFAVRLKWFPTGGMYELFGDEGILDLLHHLVLPAVSLAVVATGVVARLTRSSMLEVLRQDYVRTARAKGLREGAVIYRHALKNALVNIIPGYRHSSRLRVSAGRGLHRERLPVAGHRPHAGHRHLHPRYPLGSGRRAGRRGLLCSVEPAG